MSVEGRIQIIIRNGIGNNDLSQILFNKDDLSHIAIIENPVNNFIIGISLINIYFVNPDTSGKRSVQFLNSRRQI